MLEHYYFANISPAIVQLGLSVSSLLKSYVDTREPDHTPIWCPSSTMDARGALQPAEEVGSPLRASVQSYSRDTGEIEIIRSAETFPEQESQGLHHHANVFQLHMSRLRASTRKSHTLR